MIGVSVFIAVQRTLLLEVPVVVPGISVRAQPFTTECSVNINMGETRTPNRKLLRPSSCWRYVRRSNADSSVLHVSEAYS
jgi:hypothetical protein